MTELQNTQTETISDTPSVAEQLLAKASKEKLLELIGGDDTIFLKDANGELSFITDEESCNGNYRHRNANAPEDHFAADIGEPGDELYWSQYPSNDDYDWDFVGTIVDADECSQEQLVEAILNHDGFDDNSIEDFFYIETEDEVRSRVAEEEARQKLYEERQAAYDKLKTFQQALLDEKKAAREVLSTAQKVYDDAKKAHNDAIVAVRDYWRTTNKHIVERELTANG